MSGFGDERQRSRGGVVRRTPAGAGTAPLAADEVTALAHELGSLLDGSMRWLDLAARTLRRGNEESALEPDDLQRAAEQIASANSGLARMAELVDATMRGKATGAPRSGITLGQAIDHAVDVLTPEAARYGVRWRVEIDAEAGDLSAEAAYSVILNGLRNAVEACGEVWLKDGSNTDLEVVIQARVEGPLVVVRVSDTGVGLLEGAERAFEHGYTTKGWMPERRGRVGGVGLAVSRRLAESMGGDLRLVPRERGTTLELRYPIRNDEGVMSRLLGDAR